MLSFHFFWDFLGFPSFEAFLGVAQAIRFAVDFEDVDPRRLRRSSKTPVILSLPGTSGHFGNGRLEVTFRCSVCRPR